MKILQLCNKAPYPANDGSSIAIYNMARGLIANQVELHLMTINTKKHFKPTEQIPTEFLKDANYDAIYHDTNPSLIGIALNFFSNQSYFVTRFYFQEFENRLIEKLQNTSFDIIQLEGLFMCSYIDTIRKFSKAKIVLRAHNIEHIIWERHLENQSNFSKKWYLKLQTKRLKKFELENFQKVDAIVPITPADEMLIKEFVGDKVLRTVLTGVNMDEYSIEKSEFFEQKSIFCFGSMDWLPNQLAVQWFLDNCWPNVIREVPDCKFVIAGRNIPSSFKNLSDSRIIILENVPLPEEIYSKFNIMLVPLQSGSGLRIKIVEGLSYGKAIVSTRIGAEGISVESGKNIVLADEADEFSSRVVQLLRDSDRCNQLEINARSFASINLDNKKITSTLVEFYLNLIQD